MKAILVQYIPSTDSELARYVAKSDGVKSITRTVDVLGTQQPALTIARLLCHTYGWSVDLAGGELPNGDEVFCFRKQNRPDT